MSDVLTPTELAELDRLAAAASRNDWAALLGVPLRADKKAVQAAYYNLSRSWHPDRFFRKEMGPEGPRIEKVFLAITEAYRVLTNDAERTAWELSQPFASTAAPVPTGTSDGRTRSEDPFAAARARAAQQAAGAGAPRASTAAVQKLKAEMVERLKKARQYYLAGKADAEANNPVKAQSLLALALSLDPKNDEYKALHDKVAKDARRVQARSFVQAAENAESYGQAAQAREQYQLAVDYGIDDPRPYFRLAQYILKSEEPDRKLALKYLREAVIRAPDNIDILSLLGEVYTALDLRINAIGQYERILKLDKNHAGAKLALRNLRSLN